MANAISPFKAKLVELVTANSDVLELASDGKVQIKDSVKKAVLHNKYNEWMGAFKTTLSSFNNEDAKNNLTLRLKLYMELAAYQHVLQKLLFTFIKRSSEELTSATLTNTATTNALMKRFDAADPDLENKYTDLQQKFDESEKLKASLQMFFTDSMSSLEALSTLPALLS